MDVTKNSIRYDRGALLVTCVGVLDDTTSPPIFGSIVKHAKEAPQVVIYDLTRVTGIKTAFISGILEVAKFLQGSGGASIVVQGPMGDVLEMTGVKKSCHIVETVDEAQDYAQSHYPQVLQYIIDTTAKKNIFSQESVALDAKKWQFFIDPEKKTIDCKNILTFAIRNLASDVHLAVGKPITYRIEGAMVKIEHEPALTSAHLEQISNTVLGKHPNLKEKLNTMHDVDFGYITDEEKVSFRVNGAYAQESLFFTFRRIEQHPKTIEELGLPRGIDRFLQAKQGLVLVTGPTGSGKSTSLVAMLESINQTRGGKIITIEDPIEFIFTDNKAIFSQREVGRDTESFIAAIRAAMRENPDIVMVGEMRDTETVEAAVNLAETGHLVFSTLHTSGSVQTISRIVEFFPPDQQRQIFNRLADSLLGVISQRLIPKSDGTNKRIAIFELMIVNSGIKNLIRTTDLAQIDNAIQMGRSEGMIPMYVHAQELEKQGLIKSDDYIGYFTNQDI